MIPCKLCQVNDGQPEICVDCATHGGPRRTVGAIIKSKSDDVEFIVIKAGEGLRNVRALDLHNLSMVGYTKGDDEFLRWATQEECKQHGIPYVDRAKPDTSAPEAKKHSDWCPASKPGAGEISNCLCSPASLPKWVRITSLNRDTKGPLTVSKVYPVDGWDPEAYSPRITGDDGYSKWLSSAGTKPDPMYSTFASWEPAEDPRARQWIPKVGDQVRIKEDYADFCSMKAGTEFIVTSLVTTDKEPKDYEVYGLSTGQYVRVRNLEPANRLIYHPKVEDSPSARPELVQILSLPGEGLLRYYDRYMIEVGEVYRVLKWDNRGSPEVSGIDQHRVTLSSKGASIDPERKYYATWKPA
jgi:hypothetical protein